MDTEKAYQLLYDEMRYALDHGPSNNYVSSPRYEKPKPPLGYSAMEIIEDEISGFRSFLLRDLVSIVHEAAVGNFDKANKLAIEWEHELCKIYAEWHLSAMENEE